MDGKSSYKEVAETIRADRLWQRRVDRIHEGAGENDGPIQRDKDLCGIQDEAVRRQMAHIRHDSRRGEYSPGQSGRILQKNK